MSHNKETIAYFARFIESKTGIQYTETNFYQLENRLNAIAVRIGLKDLESLYSACVAKLDASLEKILIEEATNHETSFFRDSGIFRAFSGYILPELQKLRMTAHSVAPIRIWSNACSSGQEAYSLAILCNELGASNVQFLCTDISAKILARAKRGVFSDLEIKRGLDPKRRDQFFESIVEDGAQAWKAKDILRKNMDFREHNLLGSWASLSSYDIIFIRNVLIYQSVENKKLIIEQAMNHLSPDGFLVMGAAESLIGISDEFEQRSHEGALFYQKRRAVQRAS
jgi:chemotaxis protein methyltransferase CheR